MELELQDSLMFPMWDMSQRVRTRREEFGGAAVLGVSLAKKGVAIHGMSKVEGGTGHCANQNRPERLRGAVEENSHARLWSSGETSVRGFTIRQGGG